MTFLIDENRLEALARFMTMVDVGLHSNCWEWQGNKPDGRYGHFSFNGKAIKAHRWIYELCCGRIPDSMVIRHRCDNPSCVNPRHLTIGTPKDNANDMHERGRASNRQGEKHPMARIDESAVIQIRKRAELGESYVKIAAAYAISHQQVGKIVRRENWGHVA
jgi:hypothetical protein